jgi:hypothetical protein
MIEIHECNYHNCKPAVYSPWLRIGFGPAKDQAVSGASNQKQKANMKQERLMKLVPAGVVLAVAAFLGLTQEKVDGFYGIYAFIGYGSVVALLAMVALDYRRKLWVQGGR